MQLCIVPAQAKEKIAIQDINTVRKNAFSF